MSLQIEFESCPLCSSNGSFIGAAECIHHQLWHEPLPRSLEWMKCNACEHIYTRYSWSKEGLSEVFKNAHQNQLAGGDPDTNRTIWAPVVERAINVLGGFKKISSLKASPTWLDIGCGSGGLIMTAADFGFDSIGLDARPEAINRILSLGFNARQVDFMDYPDDTSVDVISMMDVLEHIPHPTSAIEKARLIIRDRGLLIISLPDLTSSSWRIMDATRTNPYWMEIEHYHNFSRKRLTSLLEACGFSIAGLSVPYRYKAQMELYAVKTNVF